MSNTIEMTEESNPIKTKGIKNETRMHLKNKQKESEG